MFLEYLCISSAICQSKHFVALLPIMSLLFFVAMPNLLYDTRELESQDLRDSSRYLYSYQLLTHTSKDARENLQDTSPLSALCPLMNV
jgi:hypothetical protein